MALPSILREFPGRPVERVDAQDNTQVQLEISAGDIFMQSLCIHAYVQSSDQHVKLSIHFILKYTFHEGL